MIKIEGCGANAVEFRAAPDPQFVVSSPFLKQRALELWQEGYRHHMRALAMAEGNDEQLAREELGAAVTLYSESIDICPTPEAYTFRGWAYRSCGLVDQAIEECKRAIEIDPTFGNPYNDIGAYLIDKGKLNEAIAWLQRAKTAPRYEPRHYPYVNLARVYAASGMVVQAIQELVEALRILPDEASAAAIRERIHQLRAMLN